MFQLLNFLSADEPGDKLPKEIRQDLERVRDFQPPSKKTEHELKKITSPYQHHRSYLLPLPRSRIKIPFPDSPIFKYRFLNLPGIHILR
nr:hypothetical protein [Saprospiraceae bacterium]